MSRPYTTESIFRAIADPTRRKMLDILRKGDRTVGVLGSEFRLSKPAITQHLRTLRVVGLVQTRRRGRGLVCEINPSLLRAVDQWLEPFAAHWDGAARPRSASGSSR